jgi:nicotinamidase-related amidase
MKVFLTCFIGILFTLTAKISECQKLDSTALVIIDIQDFYFPGGSAPLAEPEKAAEKAALLLDYFRKKDGLVIHVRHNHEPGGAIHTLVKPSQGEKVISKNGVNAFLNTDLDKYLKEKNITCLVLCGMQTHMCLEAATRAGSDLGYKCTVVDDACATRDLKYGDKVIKASDVHYSTLATLKSYAKILTATEFLGKQ